MQTVINATHATQYTSHNLTQPMQIAHPRPKMSLFNPKLGYSQRLGPEYNWTKPEQGPFHIAWLSKMSTQELKSMFAN